MGIARLRQDELMENKSECELGLTYSLLCMTAKRII